MKTWFLLALTIWPAMVRAADLDYSKLERIRNPDYRAFLSPRVNAADSLLESVEQTYDETQEQWINGGRTQYFYDENIRLVRDLTQIYLDPDWTNDSLNTYLYDSQDNVAENTVYRWNIATMDWKPDIRLLSTYNASGLITEQVTQGWWLDTWNNTARSLTYYDEQGLDTLVMNQSRIGETWEDETRTRNTIDLVSGTLTRTTQTYSSNGWANKDQSVFYYGQTYLDSILEQTWNGTEWETSAKIIYDINGSGQLRNAVQQTLVDGSWENAISLEIGYQGNRAVEEVYYLWEGGVRTPALRRTNSYGTVVPLAQRKKSIPRPFAHPSDHPQILLWEGKAYNLQGKRMMTHPR